MPSENRSVLITGGCGFVGTNLAVALAEAGVEDIHVLDDESVGSRDHLPDVPGLHFTHGDIRDEALVDDLLARVDAVVHLAADTRVIDSIEDPRKNFDINARGTLTILEAMRRHGRERIVNASTGGAILGEVDPPVHEEMVPRPISPYGASKLAVEGYLSAYEGSYGFAPISFRFANVYGPRSFHKGSVVAAFFKSILRGESIPVYGDGEQTRDFVFARDLATVIVDAVGTRDSGVFQLGSGRPTSINELIDLMSEIVDEDLRARVDHLPPRQGEITQTFCDISLARERLGFAPATELREGLEETWEWFREAWARPT